MNCGSGKSSPRGEEVSWMTSALMKPYGVARTGPIFRAGTNPSRLGGSIGNTRTGATAEITFGLGGSVGAGAAADEDDEEDACGAVAIRIPELESEDVAERGCSTLKSESDSTPFAFSNSISCCWLAPLVPRNVPASAAVRIPLVTSKRSNGSPTPAAGLGAGADAAGAAGSGVALGFGDGGPAAYKMRPAPNTSSKQTYVNLFLTSS